MKQRAIAKSRDFTLKNGRLTLLIMAMPLYILSLMFWATLYYAAGMGYDQAIGHENLIGWFQIWSVQVYPFVVVFSLFAAWLFYFEELSRYVFYALVVPLINFALMAMMTYQYYLHLQSV